MSGGGMDTTDRATFIALANWIAAVQKAFDLDPDSEPVDVIGPVELLVNAAHRLAKETDLMQGESGGAFVHHMQEAATAKSDVFRALAAFGVKITDPPPGRRVEFVAERSPATP